MAKRHVTKARRIVARQRRLVEQHRRSGLDVGVSEDLLHTFERSLTTFEDDLAAIIAEIKL
jgi:hypothetical protein